MKEPIRMRAYSGWFKAALLIAAMTTSVFAQSASPTKPKKARVAPSASQQDVKDLRELVGAQQQQLEAQRQQMDAIKSQLQQLLDTTQQANAAAQKVQSSAEQAQNTATQAQQSATEAQRLADQASANAVEAKTALSIVNGKSQDENKKIIALQEVLGRFRFSGDIRLRGESIFQDCAACLDRNRARVRVRFGAESKLGEDFTAGLFLATGSLGDSNSTNETVTNFFNRKTIGLDRGYITYQPVAHRWLQLTGGKFAYTWQRTSVTFDPDINPEGFSEKLSFDLSTPVLKNFTAQAIQMLFSENNSSKFLTGHDSFAVGGQVSGKLEVGIFSSTPSFTILNCRNVDAILNASAFAVQATTTVPGEGPGCASGLGLPSVPPCVYGPQGFTNATFTDSSGKIHFLSQFLYADLILNNQLKTGISRFPLNLMLEYQNNLNAADHPLDATGNATNLGKQSHGYFADLSLGQLKNRNDVQFGYAFEREEQDAIIASFSESEQRAPTNILQHRIYAQWKLRPSITASYVLWVGRTLNSNLQHSIVAPGTTPGTTEPWLKRMQFDLLYMF